MPLMCVTCVVSNRSSNLRLLLLLHTNLFFLHPYPSSNGSSTTDRYEQSQAKDIMYSTTTWMYCWCCNFDSLIGERKLRCPICAVIRVKCVACYRYTSPWNRIIKILLRNPFEMRKCCFKIILVNFMLHCTHV